MSSLNLQRQHYRNVYCTRPADERILAIERELDFGVCVMFRCLAIAHAAATPKTQSQPSPLRSPAIPGPGSSNRHALPHTLTKHLSRRSVQNDAAKVRAFGFSTNEAEARAAPAGHLAHHHLSRPRSQAHSRPFHHRVADA